MEGGMTHDPQFYAWGATGMRAVDPDTSLVEYVRREVWEETVRARDREVAKLLLRGLTAGCIIITARVYSRYAEDGNLHEEDYVGTRYSGMPYDAPYIVLSESEQFVHADEVLRRNERWLDTPQEALEAWEDAAAAREEAFQRKMKPTCANPDDSIPLVENVSTSS